MAFAEGLTGNAAVIFMVAAGLVYEIIAAACSSPQTTELNAAARSKTLMKWVFIGLVQAALFVLIAVTRLGGGKPAIYGGILAAALMTGSYLHANKAGLAHGGPPTEKY
jgi:hypothetical protein